MKDWQAYIAAAILAVLIAYTLTEWCTYAI